MLLKGRDKEPVPSESVTLPVDQWFTLVLTCDAANTTLYLNGTAQTRAVMTPS